MLTWVSPPCPFRHSRMNDILNGLHQMRELALLLINTVTKFIPCEFNDVVPTVASLDSI
jgi:hypothetical protein